MLYILTFILGIVVGGVLVSKIKTPEKKKAEKEEEVPGLIEKQKKRKEQNLQKVLELFETQEKVTNDDVESLLDVSDATATNYLDELEQRGKIKQIGKTGRHVYYKLPNA